MVEREGDVAGRESNGTERERGMLQGREMSGREMEGCWRDRRTRRRMGCCKMEVK